MKQLFPFLTAICLITLSLSSCDQKNKTYELRPLTDIKSDNSHSFTFNPSSKQTFKLPTGSTIKIPASCFSDEHGNLIDKEVQLQFKEIHSAAEIIACGLPMRYDSAGTTHHFQTAGMFDIRGTSENKEIFIAKGKQIEISIASSQKGNHFNFYAFEEENQKRGINEASLLQINTTVITNTTLNQSIKGSWKFIKNGESRINQEKEKGTQKLKQEQLLLSQERPLSSTKREEKTLVFDLAIKTNKVPELKKFRHVMWSFTEQGIKKNKEVFIQKWDNVTLTETKAFGIYQLTLSSKNKQLSTTVTPVLSGQDLKEFTEALKIQQAAFAIKQEKVKTKEKRLKKMGDVLRTASVSAFGAYNWDCLMHIIQKQTSYKKPLMTINDKQVTDFYMIYGGKNETVIHYTPLTINEFFFFKPLPSAILIIQNGEMYVVKKDKLTAYYKQKKQKNIIPHYIGSRPITTHALNEQLVNLLHN